MNASVTGSAECRRPLHWRAGCANPGWPRGQRCRASRPGGSPAGLLPRTTAPRYSSVSSRCWAPRAIPSTSTLSSAAPEVHARRPQPVCGRAHRGSRLLRKSARYQGGSSEDGMDRTRAMETPLCIIIFEHYYRHRAVGNSLPRRRLR